MPYLSQFGAHFNKKLMLSLSVVVVSTFNFSFDKKDFSPAHATDLSIKQFGIETKHGKYRLQVYWLSLHSSLILPTLLLLSQCMLKFRAVWLTVSVRHLNW